MSEPLPPPPPPRSADPFGAPPPATPPSTPAFTPAPVTAPGSGGPPSARPPRPRVTAPAALLIVGGIGMIVGTFLPWVTGNGLSFDGWEWADATADGSDAGVFTALGVILAGLGIALAAAGRLLAVAIIAVVVAALAAIAAFVDVTDDENLGIFGLEIGAGLWVILVASLVALAGAIWALAVRRT